MRLFLRGDRAQNDPVAVFTGVSCKAEVPIGSSMLLRRVVTALANSQSVEEIYCVGPDEQVITDKAAVTALFEEFNVTSLADRDRSQFECITRRSSIVALSDTNRYL